MVRVETTTRINRPVEEVFAYIDNPVKMPEWIDILAESVPSETPTRVGTRIANRVNLLGRRFENTLEVIEHVPNKKVVSKADKPFAITLTYLLEPANGATGFTTILEAEPTAFFKFGEPFLAHVGKRRFAGHLRRLKKRLEDPAGQS